MCTPYYLFTCFCDHKRQRRDTNLTVRCLQKTRGGEPLHVPARSNEQQLGVGNYMVGAKRTSLDDSISDTHRGRVGPSTSKLPRATSKTTELPSRLRRLWRGDCLEMALALMQSSVDLCQIGPRWSGSSQASILGRGGELTHARTHTPGWAIYLIQCSNEWKVVHLPVKRRLVWLWDWERGAERELGATDMQGWDIKAVLSKVTWSFNRGTHTHTDTHSWSILMACPISSAVREVSLTLKGLSYQRENYAPRLHCRRESEWETCCFGWTELWRQRALRLGLLDCLNPNKMQPLPSLSYLNKGCWSFLPFSLCKHHQTLPTAQENQTIQCFLWNVTCKKRNTVYVCQHDFLFYSSSSIVFYKLIKESFNYTPSTKK